MPAALLLVRNAATHDARVLRAARVLDRIGYEAEVVAVVTTTVRTRSEQIGGVRVRRLDPGGLFRRLFRLRSAGGDGPARARASNPAGSPGRGFLRLLRRLVLTADWYRLGVREVLRVRPRLVHCNDYNTMWIGVAARLLWRSAVVYDLHELWPDRNQRPESRWWLVACEALFVRVASVVITTSPGYAAEAARRYRVPEPRVVRNLPERTAPVGAGRARSRTVAYVGGVTTNRGLEQAIAGLAAAPGVELELIGPGRSEYVERLRRLAAEHAVEDRVLFRGPVPPARVVEALEGAGAGLCLIQPSCLSYRLTLPNKLFEYLAAGIPALASDLPVIGAFVREHEVGVAVAPDDPVTIAQAFEAILEPERNAALRARARTLASDLTWERESLRLEGAYRDALAA